MSKRSPVLERAVRRLRPDDPVDNAALAVKLCERPTNANATAARLVKAGLVARVEKGSYQLTAAGVALRRRLEEEERRMLAETEP